MSDPTSVVLATTMNEVSQSVEEAVIARFESRVKDCGPPPVSYPHSAERKLIQAEVIWFREVMLMYDTMNVCVVAGDSTSDEEADREVKLAVVSGLFATKDHIVGRCLELWSQGEQKNGTGKMTKEEIDKLHSDSLE